MDKYLSLIMGGATGAAAFLWMLYRIKRTERQKREQQKASAPTLAAVASSTAQYLERPDSELAHSR